MSLSESNQKQKEEVNPSSRFFGKLLYPFVFADVSFQYIQNNWNQGTITIQWKFTSSDEIDNNPSSRNFGKALELPRYLEGASGDIEIC